MTSGVIINQNGVSKKLSQQTKNSSVSKTVKNSSKVLPLQSKIICNNNNNVLHKSTESSAVIPPTTRAPLKLRQTHVSNAPLVTNNNTSLSFGTTARSMFLYWTNCILLISYSYEVMLFGVVRDFLHKKLSKFIKKNLFFL